MVVGEHIGVVPTLLLCVLSAMIGSALLRRQGLATLLSVQRSLQGGGMPLQELFDGFCLALAGVLLMTPGFFTDAMGFALLIPRVRVWVRAWALRYCEVQARAQEAESGIIEGDFIRLDDDSDGDGT